MYFNRNCNDNIDHFRNVFPAQQKVVSLAVKNCGVTTVHLNFCESELVKDIFTVTDCNGNNIKTLKDLPLGPGITIPNVPFRNKNSAGSDVTENNNNIVNRT